MKAYSTSVPRALLGILTGVLTGAVLVTMWSFVGMARLDDYWLRHAFSIFTYAAIVWTAGLTLVAVIPWALLHRCGLRGWPIAIILGLVLTFLVVFGFLTNGFGTIASESGFSAVDSGGPTWIDGRRTPHGWFEAFQFSAICAVVGAAVGLAVWRVAYRREAVARSDPRPDA